MIGLFVDTPVHYFFNFIFNQFSFSFVILPRIDARESVNVEKNNTKTKTERKEQAAFQF